MALFSTLAIPHLELCSRIPLYSYQSTTATLFITVQCIMIIGAYVARCWDPIAFQLSFRLVSMTFRAVFITSYMYFVVVFSNLSF